MFQEEVKNKDGVVKNIIASSQEELDEAVKIAKGDEAPYQPDINDPKDGNKVVSPDNMWVDTANEVARPKEVNPDEAPTPVPEKDVANGQGESKEEKVDVKVESK